MQALLMSQTPTPAVSPCNQSINQYYMQALLKTQTLSQEFSPCNHSINQSLFYAGPGEVSSTKSKSFSLQSINQSINKSLFVRHWCNKSSYLEYIHNNSIGGLRALVISDKWYGNPTLVTLVDTPQTICFCRQSLFLDELSSNHDIYRSIRKG